MCLLDPTKIRVYNVDAYWNDNQTILKGMTSVPIRAMVSLPLIGRAKEIADDWIQQSYVKNTDFQMPLTVDLSVDDKNFACDIEIPSQEEVDAGIQYVQTPQRLCSICRDNPCCCLA